MTPEQFIMICVYVLAGLVGLCVGSFLNVVIYRVPNGMSLSNPPSHCTRCDYQLRWYDNVPVLSYLFLGGKCRKCREPISPRYMCVELLNAALWLLCAFLYWEQGDGVAIAYACLSALVCSLLVCVFFIDLEHMLIFNRFVLLLSACGIAMAFLDGYTAWYDHLIGCAVAAVSFLGIYYGALAVLKKEGMGFGDVKLALAAGLILGWQRFILAVLIASILASIVLIIVRRARRDESGHEYPFGPFFAVGILVSMFVGAPAITWYVGLLAF